MIVTTKYIIGFNSMNKEKYLKIIGSRIQKYRTLKGLSQEELSKRCGYKSKSSISKIESGVYDIPISKIPVIAQSLNVNEIDILRGEG